MSATDALLDALSAEAGPQLVGLLDDLGRAVPAALWARALLTPVHDILGRGGKRFRGQLVQSFWALSGRDDAPPALLPLLVEYVHAGSLVVDDVQDGSSTRRGDVALHLRYGVPLAVNTGSWLYFFPQVLLSRLGLSEARELRLHRRVADTMLRCHCGQALDLTVCAPEASQVELPRLVATIRTLKTGALFELTASLAGEAAGADPERLAELRAFAAAVGNALQQLDDLGNLAPRPELPEDKRFEDLLAGRATAAWAEAALNLEPPAFAALQALGRTVMEGEAPPSRLADALREAADAPGRKRVRLELDAATEDLADVVGDHPALPALLDTVQRLRQSYG